MEAVATPITKHLLFFGSRVQLLPNLKEAMADPTWVQSTIVTRQDMC